MINFNYKTKPKVKLSDKLSFNGLVPIDFTVLKYKREVVAFIPSISLFL